ncbi:DEAD/DEAH box helicase family protein [Chakrabartyella piscis]|uniref:restriction endonuclease n=1 Tax=Chakrabartyella piscis TaxID=2918914 RepID=UPI002958BB2B|nr:DEAD/DEAH box helicase family protein [Chakrabartyella piscis]
MKLQFKIQDFQTDAVNSVCDLFLGAEKKQATFSVTPDLQMNFLQNEFGIGNALFLDDETITENMNRIQKRNLLPLTKIGNQGDGVPRSFCVGMETGTGKTYVYTKTIFEMHKKYGFTKFIIVVPSIAIREGVYKSFEITAEHFANQYDNVPNRYFIYNSAKLSDVRQFATSGNIEIMIINIDAFKKSENIINQAQDKLNGEKAIRYIQDTNPVVIIDEPQSVDNTEKAKEAISSLNPLCVLRYSATHKEEINLLYRLTPVDAYQKGLVKQIVVSSNQIENDFNKPYIKLISVSQDGGFKAKLEIDIKNKESIVSRKVITVKPNDDLFKKSGDREIYDGYTIAGIDCTLNFESVEFSNTEVVRLGKAIGAIDENIVKKAQIRRTIEAHLDKELMYTHKGIKVLSLFFIDKVDKYRTAAGEKGVYAEMFESCYNELLQLPKYAELKQKFVADTTTIHNGYFSQDKKGTFKDTKGDTIADYDTYNTIMKDKEWLLSFDCPLRFIFSHSALKEGWDNPNVFQVCTLIEQKSVFTQRQKIGRGLRLCVDQDGNRIEDKNINVLHVMANESFAEFAERLQKEMETETGIQFGVLQLNVFSGMKYEEKVVSEKQMDKETTETVVTYMVNNGFLSADLKPTEKAKDVVTNQIQNIPSQMKVAVESITKAVEEDSAIQKEDIIGKTYTEIVTVEKEVTHEEAAELLEHFESKGYITKTGKMKDTMKNALISGTLDLPQKFEAARNKLEMQIAKADNKPPIRDASREVTVKLNKQVLISPEFKEIWDRIKQKTAYRVQIDTEQLVKRSVDDFKLMAPIPKARLLTKSAEINLENAGVSHTERGFKMTDLDTSYDRLPNIISIISEETLIKRATVRRILLESGRSVDFLANPQAFLEKALEIIKHNRHELAIDGIKYVKLQGQEYYAMEIFDTEELSANLDRNAVEVENSMYNYVVYDSATIEKPFAVALNDDPDVKLFFKIPSKFAIETPIGTYNPDWAVYMDREGTEKLYFIIETKGTENVWNLRTPEQLKIHCGIEHFKALENEVVMQVAKTWDKFKIEH